ncbi:MAG TPA: phosphoribosylamine--glycine ligase [Gammaproteobacteria bacterium]|nr:phosphoribosylamine--glycine ligase [Gammaproteobacteria bacterium]
MKVLVVGGGGREHALAWKVAQSPRVDEVIVAPGNAGTALEPGVHNEAVGAEDIDGLLELAGREGIELTIVGPELPLVAGIVDRFEAAGLPCFGPRAAAARLEGSKAYMKAFLARHGIPTARHRSFTELAPALEWIRGLASPPVVKADGLAAGKGVIVAASMEEALRAASDMLGGQAFGSAGRTIVVEEALHGEEASFIVMVDGEHVLPLASSQDHKRRDDGDRGPNTGGMGAYSPAPVVTQEVHERILREVIVPAVRGLAADGVPYRGFLYAGLMIDDQDRPKVLEFNCRLGDPEAQPILFRMRSDLVALCEAALSGRLGKVGAEWDSRASLGVVLAARGYPGAYRTGERIARLPEDRQDAKLFHAGTALDGGEVVTTGGRVFCAVALGGSVTAAQANAYELVGKIDWPGAHYRTDIGNRAIERERQPG